MRGRITIKVLDGPKTVANIVGREMHYDLNKTDEIIALEATLEKVTGLRYHITMEEAGEPPLSTLDRQLQDERDSRRIR